MDLRCLPAEGAGSDMGLLPRGVFGGGRRRGDGLSVK